MDREKREINFLVWYLLLAVISAVFIIKFSIVEANPLQGISSIIFTVYMFLISIIYSGLNIYRKASYFMYWGFIIAVASVIIQITPNKHIVLVKADGYTVYKNKVDFINLPERLKAEEIRSVPTIINEKKFYELETASYHFIKFKVSSKLRIFDNNSIYIASQSWGPTVASDIKDYFVEVLKKGEKDKEKIEKLVLKKAQENIKGYWVPTKIEIISLHKVNS